MPPFPTSQDAAKRPLQRHPLTMLLVAIILSLVATLAAAKPSHAAVVQTFTGEGNQASGRWQVFDLDLDSNAIDVLARWEGEADVNIFLKDDKNNTIASASVASNIGPELISYDGPVRPTKLAVLVKSGSAKWVAELHKYGTADDLLQTFTGEGSQSSGRWQVFDLDLANSAVDVVAGWEGEADVHIFLKDVDNTTIATANAVSNVGPEVISYNGTVRPAKLAVLVKSGSAKWTAEVYQHGTAPVVAQPVVKAPAPHLPTYPGQPAAGSVLWGASQTGNGDPSLRLEEGSDRTLGVRRTFFQWTHRTSYMIDVAKADHAVGRLPWVSVKTPSWSNMAAGAHDVEIDEMLRALDALQGPVWLTVHHEPEGGGGVNHPDDPGGPSAHLAMNRRVRSRMTALGVDNVALAPIFMSWSWDPRSGRNIDQWWDSDIYDFLGVDVYDDAGTGITTVRAWPAIRTWAQVRGADIGVGEWGIRGNDATAAQHTMDWHRHIVDSHQDGQGARVIAASVYDNDYNDWRMSGEKLDAYRKLVNHTHNAQP